MRVFPLDQELRRQFCKWGGGSQDLNIFNLNIYSLAWALFITNCITCRSSLVCRVCLSHTTDMSRKLRFCSVIFPRARRDTGVGWTWPGEISKASYGLQICSWSISGFREHTLHGRVSPACIPQCPPVHQASHRNRKNPSPLSAGTVILMTPIGTSENHNEISVFRKPRMHLCCCSQDRSSCSISHRNSHTNSGYGWDSLKICLWDNT